MRARSAIANTSSSDAIDLRALGSLVRDVDAAVRGGHLRQRDEFVGRGEAAGHVLQRRADAQRALAHRLGDEVAHLLQRRRQSPDDRSRPMT